MIHKPTKKQLQEIRKIKVEASPAQFLNKAELLLEKTEMKVGRFTARRDSPHFDGDEYHAHSQLPGGYEISWSISGSRRHPNKFPAQVPRDAKLAVAKALRVSPDLLEGYTLYDNEVEEWIYLIEVNSSE